MIWTLLDFLVPINGGVRRIGVSPERVKHDAGAFIRSNIQLLDIPDLGSEGEAAKGPIEGCDSVFLLARYRIESLKRNIFPTHQ